MPDPDSGACPRDLVIVGAGGFGRESADVVEAINRSMPGTWNLKGIYDDAPAENNLRRLEERRIAYLGPLPERESGRDLSYVIGVGRPQVRRRISERCSGLGWTAATLVDPSALIGSRHSMGEGTVICAGAVISTNVSLGAHTHVNPQVTIGHDTVLQDFVSVNPAATVSGDVLIESDVLVGAGAVVLQGLTVGSGSVIGASACVVWDVPCEVTVKGVPAR